MDKQGSAQIYSLSLRKPTEKTLSSNCVLTPLQPLFRQVSNFIFPFSTTTSNGYVEARFG